MALRLFTTETGWDQARRELRFTTSALAAHDEHKKSEKAPRELLVEWNHLDQARRDADDSVVDANAAVTALDGRLDRLVGKLALRLRADFGDDRTGLFAKFFPEAPSQIIRLGLESEIQRTQKFAIVASEVAISKDAQAILKSITAVETQGTAALKTREKVVGDAARVSLRIQTWKEKANAARRSIENALDAYAIANGLPRDYADEFFPASARTSKKAKPAAAPASAPPA